MRQHNDGLRKICGCSRRTWAKCPHAWHFSYKFKDTHYRFSLDKQLGRHVDSKTTAEQEADELRIAIREGRFGQPAPRQEMTLRELGEIYFERYVQVNKAATEDSFRVALRTIGRAVIPRLTGEPLAFGDWRLTDITTDTGALQGSKARRRREPSRREPEPAVTAGAVQLVNPRGIQRVNPIHATLARRCEDQQGR